MKDSNRTSVEALYASAYLRAAAPERPASREERASESSPARPRQIFWLSAHSCLARR